MITANERRVLELFEADPVKWHVLAGIAADIRAALDDENWAYDDRRDYDHVDAYDAIENDYAAEVRYECGS